MIHVNDVLDHLVARSAAPSTIGAQLDRMRLGFQPTPDPFRMKSEVEDRLLEQAVLLRCISEFSERQEFSVTTRQRKAADAGYKVLTKLQEKAKIAQGTIAINILRTYHERAAAFRAKNVQGQEKALASVYYYLVALAPSVAPPPSLKDGDLETAFRTGKAKRARNLACEAYADALLALQNHVRVFNKKEQSDT